jgi:hypothetical protein
VVVIETFEIRFKTQSHDVLAVFFASSLVPFIVSSGASTSELPVTCMPLGRNQTYTFASFLFTLIQAYSISILFFILKNSCNHHVRHSIEKHTFVPHE